VLGLGSNEVARLQKARIGLRKIRLMIQSAKHFRKRIDGNVKTCILSEEMSQTPLMSSYVEYLARDVKDISVDL
jgi:hypothetical protein